MLFLLSLNNYGQHNNFPYFAGVQRHHQNKHVPPFQHIVHACPERVYIQVMLSLHFSPFGILTVNCRCSLRVSGTKHARHTSSRPSSNCSQATSRSHRSTGTASTQSNATSHTSTSSYGEPGGSQYTLPQSSYYLPVYTNEPTQYATEIVLEEDQPIPQSQAAMQTQTSASSNGDTQQILAQRQYYRPPNSQSTPLSSPAAISWSATDASEERLRLGFPRYESLEAERLVYERAVSYDFSYHT